MKQAAAKTALDAGDGTTTSIVLAEAIVNEIIWEIENSDVALNKTVLLNHITTLANEYAEYLERKSIKVNDKKLEAVATISANNDKEIGKIIADAYKRVGLNGVVTVEKSLDEKTYADITEGFKLDRGHASNLFINNHEKDECIFEDCHVLVCDQQIDNIFQIENVLKPVVKNQLKLLIIAPCSVNMINTLAANVVKSNLRACVVEPPNFGWKSHELMEDMALSLGATYFSEKTGDDLSLITVDDLGKAKKVIIGQGSSVIIKDDHVNEEEIKERVEQLRVQEKQTKTKSGREHVMNRIASLVGAIGVIKVGGLTDTEQKERFDRVEDAVCAVRAALEEGILPGGGLALYNFDVLYNVTHYGKSKSTSDEQWSAGSILSRALKKPFETIMRNAGCDGEELANMGSELALGKWSSEGYDAKTKKKCHLIKKGIIDPAKVTKSALLNAVSVATTIMSTNAIVTLARSYENHE